MEKLFPFILSVISKQHSSTWRWIYWTATKRFLGNLNLRGRWALQRAQYQSSRCWLLCACAFQRSSAFPGKTEVVFDFASSEAIFGMWKITCLCEKDKRKLRGGKKGKKAQLKWVEVVRYWFTIMVDPDDAHRVHLCYQRWAILIVLYYDQEYLFLKVIKQKRNKRLLSGA